MLFNGLLLFIKVVLVGLSFVIVFRSHLFFLGCCICVVDVVLGLLVSVGLVLVVVGLLLVVLSRAIACSWNQHSIY